LKLYIFYQKNSKSERKREGGSTWIEMLDCWICEKLLMVRLDSVKGSFPFGRRRYAAVDKRSEAHSEGVFVILFNI